MALKIIDHGTPEYQKMVQLRTEILRKPLGLSFTSEELEKEKENILIGAFEEDKLLGCCMLIPVNNIEIRLRQDRKSTRLNSSHSQQSRMPSSA